MRANFLTFIATRRSTSDPFAGNRLQAGRLEAGPMADHRLVDITKRANRTGSKKSSVCWTGIYPECLPALEAIAQQRAESVTLV
jgi:hypothetical protein